MGNCQATPSVSPDHKSNLLIRVILCEFQTVSTLDWQKLECCEISWATIFHGFDVG